MLGATPAQLVLYALVTLWALRLGLQSVQAYIGGRPAGVALPLDEPTARFYRCTLKAFLFYLFLGFLGLKAAALLGFPPTSLQFLEHFFQVGIFLWVLWLWRRPYLARLLPALPDPAWVRRLDVMQAIRGLVCVSWPSSSWRTCWGSITSPFTWPRGAPGPGWPSFSSGSCGWWRPRFSTTCCTPKRAGPRGAIRNSRRCCSGSTARFAGSCPSCSGPAWSCGP